MAAEEFRPLPSGYVRACMRACTCEHAAIVLPLQPLRGRGPNPALHIYSTFQIKLKFPCLFLSLPAVTHVSWRQLVSVHVLYGLLMYS